MRDFMDLVSCYGLKIQTFFSYDTIQIVFLLQRIISELFAKEQIADEQDYL